MKTIKKHFNPILFISTILAINAILWIGYMKAAYLNNASILTSVLGSSLLMGFFLVFLLSTRMGWLVKLFGGLDGIYFWHRMLAIGTTALIFVHQLTYLYNFSSNLTSIFLIGGAGASGELARNGFLFLVFFALIAKFLKYEHFRFIHRLLVIPYLISMYHGFFSSWLNLFSLNALSLWMISTSIIGLFSSLYMVFAYQWTAFRFKGEILEKTELNSTTFEIRVRMNKTYRFKPGQFAFIKIKSSGISNMAHPFSISGGDGLDIYFTIKALGDFTKSLKKSLATPSKIRITKPYGHMTFQSSNKKQVWIAGGIGVTPFLGHLRSDEVMNADTHLYYSVRNEVEAVHLEMLNDLPCTKENFRFTLFEASKQGYLSVKHLELDNDTLVFMCGPRPMVLSLKKQILEKYPNITIDYEAFSFTGTLVEDILKKFQKILRKLKISLPKTQKVSK